MTLALKQGPNGKLAVFTAADTLSIDDIDRLSGSGNMTIGGSLGATEELQLASVDGLVRVLGDLVIDGQIDADLDMGGNSITNVNLVDGVDVSAHSARHVLGGGDELDGDELDVDFTPANYTPTTGTPGTNVDHLAAHLRGIDTAIGSATGDVTGPGTHGDNQVPRWNGTDTNTLQSSGVTIDDSNNLMVPGNISVSTNGSTLASPRLIGGTDLSSGEGLRYQFGDANNGWQNGFDQSMQMWSYWPLILQGNRETAGAPSMVAGSGLTMSVWLPNTEADHVALMIDAAASQTAALTQWRTSGGTLLSQITAAGHLDLNDHDVDNARTITYNNVLAHGAMGTTETFNFSTDRLHSATASANCVITFTAPSGPCNVIIELTNGGAYTLTWPGTVTWPGGSPPALTSSGVDVLVFYYNGTNYRGGVSPDHS